VSTGRLTVRVHPGARREQVAVTEQGTVVVRVSAPALDGRANRAASRLLAKRLGVAPTRLSIVRGEHARDKVLEIDGIEQDELDRLLKSLPEG
jgi:uncharacterized protein (TIGR00251 family)